MRRALCWMLALLAWTAGAQDPSGRVVAVADGDTLTVLAAGNRPVKVRLAGIDAPERDQPFGQRSRQSLAELAFGRTATVAVSKIDDYGRAVGTVTVGGVNVEAEQVRRGLAWVYRHYSDDARLLALEAQAKAAWRGVWADPNPIPPWDWRYGGTAGEAPTRPEPKVFAGRCGALRGAAGPSGLAARWPRVKRRGFISRNVG